MNEKILVKTTLCARCMQPGDRSSLPLVLTLGAPMAKKLEFDFDSGQNGDSIGHLGLKGTHVPSQSSF